MINFSGPGKSPLISGFSRKIGVILFLVIILSLTLVSASWFSDFWGKITGKAVQNQISCTENDGGNMPNVSGTLIYEKNGKNKTYEDYCYSRNKKVREYYCLGNKVKTREYKCANGCGEGACLNEQGQTTKKLKITKTSPKGVVNVDSVPAEVALEIETSKDAVCYFLVGSQLTRLIETGGTSHSQVIEFSTDGGYAVNITCSDGFSDISAVISFEIKKTGTKPPKQTAEEKPTKTGDASEFVNLTGVDVNQLIGDRSINEFDFSIKSAIGYFTDDSGSGWFGYIKPGSPDISRGLSYFTFKINYANSQDKIGTIDINKDFVIYGNSCQGKYADIAVNRNTINIYESIKIAEPKFKSTYQGSFLYSGAKYSIIGSRELGKGFCIEQDVKVRTGDSLLAVLAEGKTAKSAKWVSIEEISRFLDKTAFVNTANCNDSDGGIYIEKQGLVKLSSFGDEYRDACLSNDLLLEYYCDNGKAEAVIVYNSPESLKRVIAKPGEFVLRYDWRRADYLIFKDLLETRAGKCSSPATSISYWPVGKWV